ncbi:S-layer homology domain-containing protein [Paenibacillus allorhizosphaerae]|uniref:SLH domain-containing protein n=1 Tax=Paenibacillus allorhizosphaerae TaxID=2849866 RepID=A0ABN7TXC9_9BACL|nr:S-layer homology domain-containing protein [Paenibacillus allorhizosphaerae]CAG7655814.1 hypothetical protein PAECIP111802_06216 [Paenibacillus allorhizosphaerae]
MLKRSKRLLATFIAASLLIHPFMSTVKANDTDYEGHWAETTIRWAMDRSIADGYGDGTFQPDRIVTEAEFLAMLIRFFPNSREHYSELIRTAASSREDWSDPYYKLSSEYDIPTNGMTERKSRFEPVNRGLVARMIIGTTGIKAQLSEAIIFMFEKGLSEGKSDKTLYGFDAEGSLTRAEAVQFLKKLAEQGLDKELKPRSVRVSASADPSPIRSIPEDTVLTVKADPSKGFYWDYLLFIPSSVENRKDPVHLLVEPNNGQGVSDNISYHEQYAKKIVDSGPTRSIAERLRIPLLVPIFPRPESQSDMFTHALDRDTLLVTSGDLKRIDLQLLAMLDDARQALAEKNVRIEDKVFMNGFSSSAKFVNRFVLLHPEKVRATTTGGVGGLPAIPADKWKGIQLQYPLGTADLKKLTGHSFDREAYNQIAQFIYMGELDKNDAYQYRDGFDPEDTALVNEYFGRNMMPDRWNKAQTIFRELNAPARFATYANTGHEYNQTIVNDIVEFYRTNSGSVNN